jgi:nucleoside-diphosphate kinase
MEDAKRQERTFVMIKPDGVQRGLVGTIINRFEQRGYKLIGMKMSNPSKEHLETHYGDLKERKFFPSLIEYMLMGPVVAMVWQGTAAVSTGRKIVGATNPLDSTPGTVRGDFCIETGRNVIHASDSVDNAEKEINLWFTDSEVKSWARDTDKWVFEI